MLQRSASTRSRCSPTTPTRPPSSSRLGIAVTDRVPTGVHLAAANARYLATKASRGSHLIDLPATGSEDRRSG